MGAGAFGRNHVRVYAELQRAGAGVELCAVVDRDPAVLAAARAQYGVDGYATVEELLAACAANGTRLDAASVCVPTVHHAEVAAVLLPAGIDLLIEKPLAATLEEADRIVELAATVWAGGAGGASGAVQSGGDRGTEIFEPAHVL